jgi:hypothetical protein
MVVTSLLKFKSLFHIPIRPSLKAGVLCFGLSLFFNSCSSFVLPFGSSPKKSLDSGYQAMNLKDYEDQFYALKNVLLKNPEVKIIPLDKKELSYLDKLVSDILINNEIFFTRLKTGTITILKTETPIHFSLPKGEIFLSKGLVSKYLKNESMLASVLAFELVKSEKGLYPKQIIIPTGHLTLERMMSFNRLGLDEKMEVHKWAHHLAMRSGFSGEYYLAWLQVQNRNTADFYFQVADPNQLTREESLFKSFIIKNSNQDQVVSKRTSPKNFYSFINRLRENL